MLSPSLGHSVRNRQLLRAALLCVSLGAAVVACSSEASNDPGFDAGSSSSGASTPSGCPVPGSNSSSSSSSGAAILNSSGWVSPDACDEIKDAAAPEDYGIFFTEERYRANFAVCEAQANRKAFADAICQRSAAGAALCGTYRAVLAVDGVEILPSDLGPGPWCAIQNGAPACTGDNVIFATRASLGASAGPDHALTRDQAGNATNPTSTFLSGLGVGSDDGTSIVSCQAWSTLDAEAGFAGVATLKPAPNVFGDWYTGAGESCATVEQPLLCVQTTN